MFLVLDTWLFGYHSWHIEFRSISYIELLSAFWGLFISYSITFLKSLKSLNIRCNIFSKYFYLIAILLIISPFTGELIPIKISKDVWNQDVCLQSTSSSCTAASMATILRKFDIHKTEKETAQLLKTSQFDTSAWDILRCARKNNLKPICYNPSSFTNAPYPSILFVKCKGIAHSITLLGKDEDKYIIGDPLHGALWLTESHFNTLYKFENFFIHFVDDKYYDIPIHQSTKGINSHNKEKPSKILD